MFLLAGGKLVSYFGLGRLPFGALFQETFIGNFTCQIKLFLGGSGEGARPATIRKCLHSSGTRGCHKLDPVYRAGNWPQQPNHHLPETASSTHWAAPIWPRGPHVWAQLPGSALTITLGTLSTLSHADTPIFCVFLCLALLPFEGRNLIQWSIICDIFFFPFFLFLTFLATSHSMQGLSFPSQGLNPPPLQWKRKVLTIGLLGKSYEIIFEPHLCDSFLKLEDSCFTVCWFLPYSNGDNS